MAGIYKCGHCLHLEDCGSTDNGWCPFKKENRDINEYPCAKWKHGKARDDE